MDDSKSKNETPVPEVTHIHPVFVHEAEKQRKMEEIARGVLQILKKRGKAKLERNE